MSDVLVVSVDDMHPLQHLEEAAAMEGNHLPTATPSSVGLAQSTTYNPQLAPYSLGSEQNAATNVEQVADASNNWSYGNNALADKQFINETVIRANTMSAGSVNSETGGITKNERNMSLPYSNLDRDSYLQNSNNNILKQEPIDFSKQNSIQQAPDTDTWSNHLKRFDTGELVNIKNSLEALKYLLGNMRPSNRLSVLDHLMGVQTMKTTQRPGEPGMSVFGETSVDRPQPGYNHLQKRTAVNPLEYYHLNSLNNGVNPPFSAALAVPTQLDVNLLMKLLNETNIDNLNMVVNENSDAVRNLLLQILHYLQQRQQQEQQYQQQQEKTGKTGSDVQATYASSPDVSFDYNKNAIKEMIQNIASYNNVDTSFGKGTIVENFLRNLQTGHLRTPAMSAVGDLHTRTFGSRGYQTP